MMKVIFQKYEISTIEGQDQFIQQVREFVTNNLTNPQFNIDYLAEEIKMSSRSFYRLIQKETGLKPNALVNEIRLITARTRLETGEDSSVSELATSVGFQDVKYFSRQFKLRFGTVPSRYL